MKNLLGGRSSGRCCIPATFPSMLIVLTECDQKRKHRQLTHLFSLTKGGEESSDPENTLISSIRGRNDLI